MDAAERWRVLRLHVEDQIPLAALARETGISSRTLQRWHQLYRAGGVAALDPHDRTDKGVRRTSTETVAFVERLALTRPRPSIATLHHLSVADAQAYELPAPSYANNDERPKPARLNC
jgi:putative transposase